MAHINKTSQHITIFMVLVCLKFKRNVKDIIQPHHDDHFLLRWLRARSWNVQEAEKMLRASAEWRKQWEVDDGLKTWVPPETLTKYYTSGVSGFSKTNEPVYIVPLGPMDITGLLLSVSSQDMIRCTIQILEQVLVLAKKSDSQQIVAIFDLEDLALKPWTWKPATEIVFSLLRMYEANYPEILKVCYIINAPKIFAMLFSVIKKCIHEYTISKIHIYKSDPKKWQPALLEVIDPDNLPKHYGGNMVDPDGNPKCPSKIRQGGKVPKSLYKQRLTDEHFAAAKEYVTTTIKKGKKLALDFIVVEDGCFIKWDFRTDDHDIRFGITCEDADGNTHVAMSPHRSSSNQVDVSGALACKAPCTYTVTFDNSYSLLRSKKLYYSVYVTDPVSKLEIDVLPSADDAKEENETTNTYATNITTNGKQTVN